MTDSTHGRNNEKDNHNTMLNNSQQKKNDIDEQGRNNVNNDQSSVWSKESVTKQIQILSNKLAYERKAREAENKRD